MQSISVREGRLNQNWR